MVNVQLLEDVPGYGPKGRTTNWCRVVTGAILMIPGSVVPVAPGRMRNIFYPRKRAAYVAYEVLRDLKKREVLMERDFTFGMKNMEDKGSSNNQDAMEMPSRPRSVNIQMDLLSVSRTYRSSLNRISNVKQPQKATKLIESILPDIIPFYRTPISSPKSKTRLEDVAIYGSVSVVDIAEEVKSVLGATDEGARVVIEPEDIKIMDDEGRRAEVEVDRIKALGDFAVEIRAKNGVEVKRIVRILAQERL